MKVNVEIDMTPEETREVMEPPDGAKRATEAKKGQSAR